MEYLNKLLGRKPRCQHRTSTVRHNRPVWERWAVPVGGGARATLTTTQARVLLNLLSAIVRLRTIAEDMSLCWTLQGMVDELERLKPGGGVVAHALARMTLVEALRVHIKSSTGNPEWRGQ